MSSLLSLLCYLLAAAGFVVAGFAVDWRLGLVAVSLELGAVGWMLDR